MALSLSMANRISILKSKKEEMQAVALQKSEEMNEVKSYFLSNMSHELRTPLNAILGLTTIMEAEVKDAKSKANCEEIKSAAFNLISSDNDIMDFSKIEKDEIRLDCVPFRPQEILEKVRLSYERQALEKGLTFVFNTNIGPQAKTVGDPTRLGQIINNVLSNAVKFTESGFVQLDIVPEKSAIN